MSAPIIYQSELLPFELSEEDFAYSFWQHKPGTLLLTGGRGSSQAIKLGENKCVLRQYMRGGMVARLLKREYLWTGLHSSRPEREMRAIKQALQNNLPVPDVVAYIINRKGMFYKAAIISEFIPNQGTLASCLCERSMDDEGWGKLGRLIRLLHRARIFHADLNANNILIDKDKQFHLIDFDKASITVISASLGQSNLDRLKRSLNKIRQQRLDVSKPFYFSEENWQLLEAEYHAAADGGVSR